MPKSAEQKNKEARERMAKRRENPDFRESERIAAAERMAKRRQNLDYREYDKPASTKLIAEKRQNPDYKVSERIANAERIAKKRQNTDYRKLEKFADAIAHKKSRLDSEFRTPEKQRDAAAHRIARQDPEFRTPEKQRDAQAHRNERQDPEFRTPEKQRDAQAHRNARQDPEFRTPEKQRDAQAHRNARQDQEFRTPEKQRDAQAHRNARQDPEFRTPEKQRDAQAHRNARQDPEFRTPEKQRDAQAHRNARQDPEFRTPEKQRDAQAHRNARQDPEFRTPEKQRDGQARSHVRNNPVRRLTEQLKNAETYQAKTKLVRSNYSGLILAYNNKIRCAPSIICSCCGGLFYETSTFAVDENKLKEKACTEDTIKKILHVIQTHHRLCSTCKIAAFQKRVPKLCLANGFDFPDVPPELKDLSPLEERLVALRLPFMQIRLLGSERQSVLKGNVVNVENDLDVCAEVLPRQFDNTSTVQVQLMRKINYKSPYMYETIRPLKVYQAAKFLINSELYKMENVALSDDWRMRTEDATEHFICSIDEENAPQLIDEDENDNNPSDTLYDGEESILNLGADETLYFREDEYRYTGIRIAPGEGKFPIPLYLDIKAEVLSFPKIYAGNDRHFKEGLKISYTDIAKSELRRYDRRVANDTSKILYAFKKSYNEKVYQAVQVCMRKVGRNGVTAGNIRTPGYIEGLIRNDDGYAVFKKLRSSPAYWKDQQKKVIAMIRQRGKCAFFITLSAAETKWNELLVILMKVVKNRDITEEEASTLPFTEKAELIRSDPVTCIRHFDHRFKALLNLILKPEGGVFAPHQLVDFFSRFEYQLRGSPHSHGLYWISDAPVYIEGDNNSEKECVAFIDEFITCERCEEGKMKKLIGYQFHRHSHTCEKKLKKGEKCRFGFPKPPMEETRILAPLPQTMNNNLRKLAVNNYSVIQEKLIELGRENKEDINFEDFLLQLNLSYTEYIDAIRSSIKRTTVFLKRSTNAIFVNAYNRLLLEAWEANIDVQFVLDIYACAKYCVGYILKSEGGISSLLRAATLDARRGNTIIGDKLKKFANILIHGSEISAQEASAFILGIANTACSRSDVYISTCKPEERVRMIKSQNELEELDDNSEDVCVAGLLHHYTQRPNELENKCLAEFASMYDYSKTKKSMSTAVEEYPTTTDLTSRSKTQAEYFQLLDKSGWLRKRQVKNQKIIRFRHYGKVKDPKDYSREQLMLFLPWRDEEMELVDEQLDVVLKAEENKEIIFENSKPFYYNREFDDVALVSIMNEFEDEESPEESLGSANDKEEIDEYNISDPVNIEAGTSRVVKFLPPRLIPELEYRQLMRTLNDKQRRFVLHIMHLLKTTKSQFNIFLSGGAGVGKSQSITAIVQSYLRFHSTLVSSNPASICVIVSAPTGKAAFNVFGMTLHSTFKLRPNQAKSFPEKNCKLNDADVNTLRVKLDNTKLFIIDEISMVSVKMLYEVDERLQQIFATKEPFGGKSILAVGHLRQLPPVGGSHVFKDPTHLPLGRLTGNPLWELFSLYELDEIMRQKGEAKFCKALNNMAEGTMDMEDINLIQARQIQASIQPPINAIHLFTTNQQCQEFNSKVHSTIAATSKQEGALCRAFDQVDGRCSKAKAQEMLEYAKKLKAAQYDGLPYETNLQVGGEYFVTSNIDVLDGLFNGSTGCLKMVEFGTTSSARVPTRAWMDFRNPLVGAEKRNLKKQYQMKHGIPLHWTPIDKMKKNLPKTERGTNLQISRTQIPLVAANGMTIWKAQGSSIEKVVVNVENLKGKKDSRELLYVACSRSTSYEGLFIDGKFEPPMEPPINDAVTLEMARLRRNPFKFSIKFLQDYDESYEKIYFHNVDSIVAHYLDVLADHCAMSSNYLAFVEPKLLMQDKISLANYSVVHRTNCGVRTRNSKGALVFSKKNYPINKESFSLSSFYSSPGIHFLFLTWKIFDVNCIMVYKHPDQGKRFFFDKLSQQLSVLSGDILVFGDINLDLRTSKGNDFIELMNTFNLTSRLDIQEGSTDGNTHIDICFSNIENLQAWYYECYYGYHKPICMVWPKHYQ